MCALKLKLEDLAVESFPTARHSAVPGTVKGHAGDPDAPGVAIEGAEFGPSIDVALAAGGCPPQPQTATCVPTPCASCDSCWETCYGFTCLSCVSTCLSGKPVCCV
jgi:hypothetical protein